jgi:hypothetical protein
MATVIILSHKAQTPLTANDLHTMATVVTTHTFINVITKTQNALSTANDDKPTNQH